MTSICLLPEVLLEYVFTWIPWRDVIRNISSVCKFWHLLSHSEIIWNEFTYQVFNHKIESSTVTGLFYFKRLLFPQIGDSMDALWQGVIRGYISEENVSCGGTFWFPAIINDIFEVDGSTLYKIHFNSWSNEFDEVISREKLRWSVTNQSNIPRLRISDDAEALFHLNSDNGVSFGYFNCKILTVNESHYEVSCLHIDSFSSLFPWTLHAPNLQGVQAFFPHGSVKLRNQRPLPLINPRSSGGFEVLWQGQIRGKTVINAPASDMFCFGTFWVPAIVVQVTRDSDSNTMEYKIKYCGWSDDYDEVVSSSRIRWTPEKYRDRTVTVAEGGGDTSPALSPITLGDKVEVSLYANSDLGQISIIKYNTVVTGFVDQEFCEVESWHSDPILECYFDNISKSDDVPRPTVLVTTRNVHQRS